MLVSVLRMGLVRRGGGGLEFILFFVLYFIAHKNLLYLVVNNEKVRELLFSPARKVTKQNCQEQFCTALLARRAKGRMPGVTAAPNKPFNRQNSAHIRVGPRALRARVGLK